jgi:hypothetical protein
MVKKTILCIFFILAVSLFSFGEEINCGFTEDNIISLLNNLDEIDENLFIHENDYNEYFKNEIEYFAYLEELIFGQTEMDRDMFISKHKKIIKEIPMGLNDVLNKYPELKDSGYELLHNFMIFIIIMFAENIYNGKLDPSDFDMKYSNVNINILTAIKSVFNKKDVDTFYSLEEEISWLLGF